MAIKIRPTAASGLSSDLYSVKLPEGEGLSFVNSRPIKIAQTLSQESVITAWPKKISGANSSVSISIEPSAYEVLKRIDDCQTCTEWSVAYLGKSYICVVNITSATPDIGSKTFRWRVTIEFTVVRMA